ncbi:hypothetical protein ACFLTX_01905 [Chloroflexota bacterium]
MNFSTAAKYANLLTKGYAEDIFALLINYQAISASEAATRLNIHIKTAQDFLENLSELGVLAKEEVLEKKRPYFRYHLKQTRIVIDLDLEQIRRDPTPKSLATLIRENENAGARFTTARRDDAITSVTIWGGTGRERKERRIKLTNLQGRFLFHLPFPKATPLSVAEIMNKADLEESSASEILDLVQLLIKHEVIEQIAN